MRSPEKISSFSSIQPFPSRSYLARSAKPSPLTVPNSSEPSLILPSPFLSSARKPEPLPANDISSFSPSESRSKKNFWSLTDALFESRLIISGSVLMYSSTVSESILLMNALDIDTSTLKSILLPSAVFTIPADLNVVHSLSTMNPLLAVILCHVVPVSSVPKLFREKAPRLTESAALKFTKAKSSFLYLADLKSSTLSLFLGSNSHSSGTFSPRSAARILLSILIFKLISSGISY